MNGAGVDSGDTIRIPGAGNAGGQGSQPGNLFIKLKAQFALSCFMLQFDSQNVVSSYPT